MDDRNKVPLRPRDPTDASAGLSFGEALQGLNSPASFGIGDNIGPDEALLLGFIFTSEDPFVLVDWDNVREPTSGNVPSLVRKNVAKLGGYVEISILGTGFRQVGRIDETTERLIQDHKSKSLLLPDPVGGLDDPPHVQIYDRTQYMTVTGWSPDELDASAYATIDSMSEPLYDLFDRYFDFPWSTGRSENASQGESSLTEITDALSLTIQ
jgi:hypothetical protein